MLLMRVMYDLRKFRVVKYRKDWEKIENWGNLGIDILGFWKGEMIY